VLAIGVAIEKTVVMRGNPDPQLAMLSSLSTEDLIPPDHPLRKIRVVVDAVLAEMDDTFDGMYAAGGRRSVPPETLLKATVLMALYSIRSERALCERLNYDLLFKRPMAGCRPDSVGDENGAAARRRRNHLVLRARVQA
jgi:transposase